MTESRFDGSPDRSCAATRWNPAASTLASVVEKWNPGSKIDSASEDVDDGALDIVFSVIGVDGLDLGVDGIK